MSRGPYRTGDVRPDLSATVASLLDPKLARAEDLRLARAAENAKAKYISRLPLPWDPFVAGVATLLSRERVPELVDLFIEEAGLRGAIDALVDASRVYRFHPYQQPDDIIAFCTNAWSSPLDMGEPGLWEVLQRALRSASPDAYASARLRAEEHRKQATPAAKAALAYAFPKEPWAAEDLERGLGEGKSQAPSHLLLLLTALDAPELVEKLCDTTLEFRSAFDDGRVEATIARFGVRSLKFAKRLLQKRSGRLTVVQSLLALDVPEAIEVCLGVFGDPKVREPIAQMLAARPRVGIVALAKTILKNKDQARLLSPLLATIVAKHRTLAIELGEGMTPKEQALLASLGASEWMIEKCSPPIAAIVDGPAFGDAWKSLARWMHRGAPAAEATKLLDVAWSADAKTIGRLAQLARVTARNDGLACAMAIVDALEAVATPAAVREIARMTRDLVEPLLGEHAEQSLTRLQAKLGLSDDDMADRSVPDYGATGPIVHLDFGPRTFRVELDGSLKPRLFDDNGVQLKSLPRARKTDDPEKAKRASALFTRLRDESTAVGKQQAARWETAMVEGRRWSPASLRDVILAHPILSNLAQRVVWLAENGQSFRVAEDLTFANVADDPISAPTESVRIAHHLEIEDELATWGSVFSGYEILQPFEQLVRRGPRLAGPLDEALAGFAGKRTRSSAAHHILEERGWSMTFVGQDEALLQRSIRGREASARLRVPEAHGAYDDLKVLWVEMPDADPVRDAISIAEVLRDLDAITM